MDITSDIKEIEKKALELSNRERALLIRQLLRSLDEDSEEENADELWIKEAEYRYSQFKQKKVSDKSADDVLKDARNNLK
ncbi:MAG: addiction module protein [Candidatus Odinarchaeota archaeon]